MNFFKLILIFSFFFIGFQSFGQISEKHYRIYSIKSDREVTLNDIAGDMKNYDVLFFGEEHNDSVAHYLENKMFEMLYQKFSSNVALSMEMFDRDVQTVMNEYLNGSIRERNFTKDAFQSQTGDTIFNRTTEDRKEKPKTKKDLPEDTDRWSLVNYLSTFAVAVK